MGKRDLYPTLLTNEKVKSSVSLMMDILSLCDGKHSILEGSVESIIGAVFLDSNWKQTKKFIKNLFKQELANIEVDQEFRDSKTELQELLQSKKLELPKYITTESNTGFDCKILIDNQKFTGSGNSKRHSEIAVAKEALKYLKSKNG